MPQQLNNNKENDMGMDVYGLNPTTTAPAQPNHDDFDSEDWKAYWEGQSLSGQYFRNNVWWWRPLWDYVYSLCDDFISEERYEGGHSNHGEHFTDKEAKQIAVRLLDEIKHNDTEAYQRLYEIKTENDEIKYPFYVENVRAFALFCRDSGGFEIC